MVQTRLMTAEDLVGLPDEYELYEGVPHRVAAAPDVSAIALTVASLLWNHVDVQQLGVVFGADASFRLSRNPDVVYLPDAAFVREDRVRTDDDLDYPFEGAPDLAVEVRSLSDTAAELERKMRDYLVAGTRLGWAIDPVARTVTVYRPESPVDVLRDDEILTGGDVLPGLRITIDRILRVRPRPG